MANYVAVAKLADLKEDTGRTIEVKGRLVALFLQQGTVHAIDDICPHMGASLGSGSVCDGIVMCPWHGWRFRVTDGAWADAPTAGGGVTHYDTKVDDGTVYLNIGW